MLLRFFFIAMGAAGCGSDLGRLCDGKNGDTTRCGANLSCKQQAQLFAVTSDGTNHCDNFLVCTKSCSSDTDCLIVGGACHANDTCNGKHNLCTTR